MWSPLHVPAPNVHVGQVVVHGTPITAGPRDGTSLLELGLGELAHDLPKDRTSHRLLVSEK